MKPDFHMPTCS